MWYAVALLAILPLFAAISESDGWILTDFRMMYVYSLVGIAAFGICLNWGPFVPCVILTYFLFILMTDPISSSYEEAFQKDYVVPLTGAIFGAMIGAFFEWNLSNHAETIETETECEKIAT